MNTHHSKPSLPRWQVYFAVAKKGEPPLDGKTDTDPEGLSAVNAGGKWAREVHWRLTSSNLKHGPREKKEEFHGVSFQDVEGNINHIDHIVCRFETVPLFGDCEIALYCIYCYDLWWKGGF